MTTLLQVNGTFGKTEVRTIMSEDTLAEYLAYASFTLESATPVVVTPMYPTVEGCARCAADAYVPHYNCLYHGNAIGHSAAHCTADSCY